MKNLILTLIIGIIVGYFFDRKKIPAGFMIGSLFGVACLNIFFNSAFLPPYFKIGTQIATGTYLGTKFYKKDLLALKSIIIPGSVMVIIMILFSLGISYIMHNFFGLDYVTAVFSSSPGGLMDISLLAYEFNANTSQVALLQLIRLISVITFVPFFCKKCYEKKYKKKLGIKSSSNKNNDLTSPTFSLKKDYNFFILTIIIGSIGGFIGYFLKIPAGAMSCSMVAVAFFNIKSSKAYMPLSLRKVIQAVGGALIGSRVTINDVLSIKTLIIPIIIIIVGFAMMNILVGFFLYKTTKFSLSTSLLSASPGGMSDIAIISGDLGANSSEVAMMQFLRASSIIAIYPLIIKFLFT